MNILELDEAQGIDAEMVRQYMRNKGWQDKPGRLWWRDIDTLDWHQPGSEKRAFFEPLLSVSEVIRKVAAYEKRSVQYLLRELNPRMRKGMPSLAAIEGHGIQNDWLMKDDEGVLRTGYFEDRGNGDVFFAYDTDQGGVWLYESSADLCSFWPCDAHGNKCRWPEKDGVML